MSNHICLPGCVYSEYHPGPCATEDDIELDEWFLALMQDEDQHPEDDNND